jgi:hypothetical protein
MGKNHVLGKRRKGRHTAPVVDQLRRRFRVIHPFHPARGLELELVRYRRSWGRESVDGWRPGGNVMTVPLAWTDACAPDPFAVVSGGRSYFRVEDLVGLVRLVAEVGA